MRSFTIVNAEQRSPEWFAARLGRLTGSNAGKMLAKVQKGEAADRRNLRLQLILERLTGKSQEKQFQSEAMKVGIEREPDAIAAYEAHTGFLFESSGFLSHNEHMAGCSLDAHLGDFEILVSIKCRQPAAHWDFLRAGIVPASALAQLRHELWITGAKEHHYVSWQPDFPAGKTLHVKVYRRDELDVPGYELEALRFLAEVNQELSAIDGWNAIKEGAVA